MIWLLLACGTAPTVPDAPAPDPAPVVRPSPPEVTDAAALEAVLTSLDEKGACRDGKLRVDGVVVLDADLPAHAELLVARVAAEPLQGAVVAIGLLWDARVALPSSSAPALAARLDELHAATEMPVYACRQLKTVRDEGLLWNARGDALALFSLIADKEASKAALAPVITKHPRLADPGAAALGDAEAYARLTQETYAQLCLGRTWETHWLLRSLDIARKGGSLEPLSRREAGPCPVPPAPDGL
jgi:hypothetical protein